MIVCFSGTGNSLQVARMLSSLTGHAVRMLPLTGEPLAGTVIWVFPIYSWGIPPVILDAVKTLAFADGTIHHMVATCGDDCGYADKMFRKAIATRGGSVKVTATVIAPNNYVTLPGFDVDSREAAAAKLAAIPTRVSEIADMIASGIEVTSVTRGSLPWIKTRLIYPGFCKHAMSTKAFHPTDACIGCGLCARTCPMDNIAMSDATRRPMWSDRCAFCLRCYHICPHHAVAYGKTTAKKSQYINPSLMSNLKEIGEDKPVKKY